MLQDHIKSTLPWEHIANMLWEQCVGPTLNMALEHRWSSKQSVSYLVPSNLRKIEWVGVYTMEKWRRGKAYPISLPSSQLSLTVTTFFEHRVSNTYNHKIQEGKLNGWGYR